MDWRRECLPNCLGRVLIMLDPSWVLAPVCCTFSIFFSDPESSLKTKHSGQPKGTSSQQLLHTNILFELQVWLASTQSIDLELQLGSRAPVGWSFNVVQGVWQTTDASPQITIPRGESLVRLWASTSGLRIRLVFGGKMWENIPYGP